LLFNKKKSYHSLLAVRPSKKARCPPLGVVANTMFLFALHSSQGMASLVQSGSSKALIQSKGTDTLPI